MILNFMVVGAFAGLLYGIVKHLVARRSSR